MIGKAAIPAIRAHYDQNWDEERYNRATRLLDRLDDREKERKKTEDWEFMKQTLAEAYPTRIPENWLR